MKILKNNRETIRTVKKLELGCEVAPLHSFSRDK
jgi:hypothetical protein